MVSKEVCRKCIWCYMKAPPRSGGIVKFRHVWRCLKDSTHIPSMKVNIWQTEAKVLWEEENPIKGCPYMLQHAIACAANLRKIS